MSKTPVYLITGFLGSGKTTFLERAIDYFDGKGKIGIVQNEFAPANFDGKELKRVSNSDFDLLEINNGSVFCVCLLSGFIASLKKFELEYKPDLLLIETSGLSDVISVGQVFNSPELQEIIYLAGTICIVDANHFLKIKDLMPRVKHQLMIADHVLINKTDLNRDHHEITTLTNEINPFGKKYLTTYCDAAMDEIFKPVPYPSWQKLPKFIISTENIRPDVHTAVFRSVKPILSEKFKDFISVVASKSFRLKGIVCLNTKKSFSVQAVFNDIQYIEIEQSDPKTELIAMGKDIDARELKNIYQQYSRDEP